MGIAWEAIFARRQGIMPPALEEKVFSLLREIGFALDDPGLALSSIASAVGMDKKRVLSDVELPMVTAPGACRLVRTPLSLLRKELPAIRAEIMRRGRETGMDSAAVRELQERMERGGIEEATALLEARVGSNPTDLTAMVLLTDAYRRAGKLAAAWEMIKEALQQYPADARAQRMAREIEEELHSAPRRSGDAPPEPLEDVILLPEGAFEIRPADLPQGASAGAAPVPEAEEGAPPVRTITMADVYWEQGERDTARRIVDEILMRDPEDRRAAQWKKAHEDEVTQEVALTAFLGAIAKEFGYDLS
jgi:tetratricopeptide (TPR) repeat protein